MRPDDLHKRDAAPRIELIETARPLFHSFELTRHALHIRILESTRYPLLPLSPVSRPKIGETAAGERGPLDSLFEVAPEAQPKKASNRCGEYFRMDVGGRKVNGDDGYVDVLFGVVVVVVDECMVAPLDLTCGPFVRYIKDYLKDVL